jgi:hypothetical protein
VASSRLTFSLCDFRILQIQITVGVSKQAFFYLRKRILPRVFHFGTESHPFEGIPANSGQDSPKENTHER